MKAIVRVYYEEGEGDAKVVASAAAQVTPEILKDSGSFGAIAVRLLPAINVFVELERERVAGVDQSVMDEYAAVQADIERCK